MTLYVSAASGGGLSINAKFFSDMKAAAGEYDGALGTLKAALGKKDSQVGTRPHTPLLKGPAQCCPPVSRQEQCYVSHSARLGRRGRLHTMRARA